MSVYKSIKTKTLIKVLNQHGFVVTEGSNHTKVYCNEHGTLVILPRHSTLSPGVVKNITNLLISKCNFDETELTKKLK